MADVLSPLYSAWVEQAFAAPLPSEAKATCQACVMLAPSVPPGEQATSTVEPAPGEDAEPGRSGSTGERPAAGCKGSVRSSITLQAPPGQPEWFNPRTKCCTYIPDLAGFLVGALLASSDPQLARGQASVRQRIAAGVGVTPLGLAKPRVHALLYAHGAPSFGRAERLRCPHYLDEQGGQCGIWRHSSAVCSTWYCKYDQGGRGADFWGALRELLLLVERRLSLWCLLDMGLEPDHLQYLTQLQATEGPLAPHDLDEQRSPAAYAKAWRHLAGHEVDHYLACASKVAALRWEEVRTICGPEAAVLERVAHMRLQGLPEIPARLKMGSFRVLHSEPSAHLLETYSPLDPLRVTRILVDHLHLFDGQRTWREVLQHLADEFSLRVDPAVIKRLVDHGVLIPTT